MQCSSTAVWGKGSLLHRGQLRRALAPEGSPVQHEQRQPQPRDPRRSCVPPATCTRAEDAGAAVYRIYQKSKLCPARTAAERSVSPVSRHRIRLYNVPRPDHFTPRSSRGSLPPPSPDASAKRLAHRPQTARARIRKAPSTACAASSRVLRRQHAR